jgi:hypothetical protein
MAKRAKVPTSVKVADLKPDKHNANRGTKRGYQALENSLQQYGAGRSILIDRNGNVIAGNKTLEKAGAAGIEDVQVVETDGNVLVAVKRTDLDLETDPEARELAYADNITGKLSLDWDVEQMLQDHEDGIEIPFFTSEELSAFLDIDAGQEFDESVADGLSLKGRFIIECPMEDCDDIELKLKALFKDEENVTVLRSETV